MSYQPVSGIVPQYSDDFNQLASGFYLKFYVANTTTPLSMATDSTGSTTLVKCKLNPDGLPISNPLDNDTVFIPHVNQDYRLVVYRTEVDANADNTAAAFLNVASLTPLAVGSISGGVLPYVFSSRDDEALGGQAKNLLEAKLSVGDYAQTAGKTTPGDGEGQLYEIVASGGDVTLDNGNEAKIVSKHKTATGTQTVAEMGDARGISRKSVTELLALDKSLLIDRRSIHISSYFDNEDTGGGFGYYDANRAVSEHNGGTIISLTVPWNGTAATHPDFVAGVGETNVGGTGCWVRENLNAALASEFGARPATADVLYALQKAIDTLDVLYLDDNYKTSGVLKLDSYKSVIGLSKGGIGSQVSLTVTGSSSAIESKTKADPAANFHCVVKNIRINNDNVSRTANAGYGVDLANCSYWVVENCSFRYWNRAISFGTTGAVAGFYNMILDCEMAVSNTGVYHDVSGNSNRVIGGRIFSCITGAYAVQCTDNTYLTAFEKCENGLHLDNLAEGFFVGSRFEGNGKDIATSDLIKGKGAVVAESGALRNVVISFFSGDSDKVIDKSRMLDITTTNKGITGTARGNGSPGYFVNPTLSRDSNSDGVADGLVPSAAAPAGTTWSIDTTNKVVGSGSQRWEVASTGSSRRDFNSEFKVTPGAHYSVVIRCKSNITGGWNVRIGDTAAGTSFMNRSIDQLDDWVLITANVIATSTGELWVQFWQNPTTVGGGFSFNPVLQIDSMDVYTGNQSVDFANDHSTTVKSCTTATRPATPNDYEVWFDTTLGYLITFNGTNWVNGSGTIV